MAFANFGFTIVLKQICMLVLPYADLAYILPMAYDQLMLPMAQGLGGGLFPLSPASLGLAN